MGRSVGLSDFERNIVMWSQNVLLQFKVAAARGLVKQLDKEQLRFSL
jgi:hypothetical protein